MSVGPILTQSKISIPRDPGPILVRPRLYEKLYARSGGLAITLVTAPPGYGKTSLVSQWLSSSGVLAAWLSLDSADNDPGRFFAYLVYALDSAVPGLGRSAGERVACPPRPSPGDIVDHLVADFEALETDLVLVFDDIHLLESENIRLALGDLFTRLPPRLRIILLSRSDPPFPLARLRSRGLVSEIREADLAFSQAEAFEFFARLSMPELNPVSMDNLLDKTEGWAAGLRLASLSLKDESNPAEWVEDFAGTHRYVADYLVEEVLERLPPNIRNALPVLALPEEICPDLAETLLNDTEPPATGENIRLPASDMIRYLQERNLFLVSLGDPDGWLRFHALFRQFLLHRLESSCPERLVSLHLCAAEWYAGRTCFEPAIRHYLAAGSPDRAAEILGEFSARLWDAQVSLDLSPWMRRLSPAAIASHPQLSLYAARVDLLSGNLEAAGGHMAAVVDWLESDSDSAAVSGNSSDIEIDLIRGRLALQEANLAFFSGDTQEMDRLCDEAESLLGSRGAIWNGIAAATRAVARLWSGPGDVEGATRYFRAASAYYRKAGIVCMELGALFQEGVLLGLRGNTADAREHLAGLIRRFERDRLIYPGLEANIRIEWAWWESECGGTTGIRENLEQSLMSAKNSVLNLEHWWTLYRAVSLYHRFGEDHEARRWLNEMDDAGELTRRTPWFMSIARSLHVILDAGDSIPINSAMPWCHACEAELAAFAVSLHRRGKSFEALDLTRRMITYIRPTGRIARMLEMMVLESAILLARGDESMARANLTEALKLGSEGSFVAVFREGGESLVSLVRQIAESGESGIDSSYLNHILTVSLIAPGLDAGTTPAGKQALYDLSERELEVLVLIDAGSTNQEIADRLFVSVNTVKTHLKNINIKLSVDNRRKAVAAARRAGLI